MTTLTTTYCNKAKDQRPVGQSDRYSHHDQNEIPCYCDKMSASTTPRWLEWTRANEKRGKALDHS